MNVLKREFYVEIMSCGECCAPNTDFYETGNKNDVIKSVKQFLRYSKCNRTYVMKALTANCSSKAKSFVVPEYHDENSYYIFISGYSVTSVEKPQFNEQGEDVEEKRKSQVLAQKNSLTRLRNEVDFYSTIITELLRKDIIHKIVSGIRINGQNRIVTPSYVFVEKAGISFMFNVMSKNGDIDTFLEKFVDTENDNDFRCTCYKKSFKELSKLMHDLEDISKRVRIAVEKESVNNA